MVGVAVIISSLFLRERDWLRKNCPIKGMSPINGHFVTAAISSSEITPVRRRVSPERTRTLPVSRILRLRIFEIAPPQVGLVKLSVTAVS